jgi:predicted RNase H-like nuclease (RuvC/YqgF family)
MSNVMAARRTGTPASCMRYSIITLFRKADLTVKTASMLTTKTKLGGIVMDDVDFQALTEKISNLTLQNKQLKRANLNMKREVKHLRRVIKKLKDDAAKNRKEHYRNGKRGSKFNG